MGKMFKIFIKFKNRDMLGRHVNEGRKKKLISLNYITAHDFMLW